jgi:hypothetical protein
MNPATAAIDAAWRIESAKIIRGLPGIGRDGGVAEELVQDALIVALEHGGPPAGEAGRGGERRLRSPRVSRRSLGPSPRFSKPFEGRQLRRLAAPGRQAHRGGRDG